ncbi:MAG: NADH-quinone oxidoreductase subunit C [Elusimicrobiota bacterium]
MQILDKIEQKFDNNIKNIDKVNDRRVYIEIDTDYLRKAARFFFDELGFRFSTATAVDEKDYMEIIYHFSYDKKGIFLNLIVKTDLDKARVDTLTDIIKGTKWIERELIELMGIEFEGNEDTENLLLSKDYRGKKYPLRKR